MGTSLGRAAKCPLTHAKLEAWPEKGKRRWDLSRSCPGKSRLLSLLPFLASPSSTLDDGLLSPDPHSHPPNMFHDDLYPPSKDFMSQPLYVRQPCSLQIIQLVECSPPPPQQHKYSPSTLSSSSPYSDSHSSSAYDSDSSSLSAASSYCSSAELSAAPVPPSFDNRDPSLDDTYHTRQRRVSLWRDAVYSKDIPTASRSSPFPFVVAPFEVQFSLSFTRSPSRFSVSKAKNSRW